MRRFRSRYVSRAIWPSATAAESIVRFALVSLIGPDVNALGGDIVSILLMPSASRHAHCRELPGKKLLADCIRPIRFLQQRSEAADADMSAPTEPSYLPSGKMLSELNQMQFPGYITATVEYFATGEGTSVWIFMGHMKSEQDFLTQLRAHCDRCFMAGVSAWQGLVIPPEVGGLVPVAVRSAIESFAAGKPICNFSYRCHFHINAS